MINHVVLFKLKDYPANEKPAVIAKMKAMLESLKGKIDELIHIEVGTNYELEAKSYDIALITHFKNLEGLDKYRIHPEHQKVIAYFAETVAERAAVDFEF